MDYLEWIQLVGIFLAVGAVAFIVVLLAWRRPQRRDTRLEESDSPGRDKPDLVLGNFTTALADYLPSRRPPLTELHNDLRSAGYYRPTAIIEYKAVRNLLVLLALLATAALALLLPGESLFQVLGVGLVVAGLAFSLPRVYLVFRGRLRSHAIERGLPLAIDMLILCLSAGQNLLAALLQVARQLHRSNPVLAQELTIAHQQADLHSLAHALTQWAERVRLPEVRNLVMLLIQSEKLGADAANTLSELANNFRSTARQRAEAQANRTSFWMLFPSVFCFWVAAAVVLIGPAYLDFLQYQNRAPELFNSSLQTIKSANPPAQPTNPVTSPGQGQ